MSYINSGTTGTGRRQRGREGKKDPIFKISTHWSVPVTLCFVLFFSKTYYSIWDAAKIMTKHHEPLSIWLRMKFFLPDLQNDICRCLKNQFKLLSYKEEGVRKKRLWRLQKRLIIIIEETSLFQSSSACPRKQKTSGKWRCNSFAVLSGALLPFLHCTPSSPIHSAIWING